MRGPLSLTRNRSYHRIKQLQPGKPEASSARVIRQVDPAQVDVVAIHSFPQRVPSSMLTVSDIDAIVPVELINIATDLPNFS